VLRRLISEYNVIQVTYDPYQLHDMAMRLRKEGLAWFKPFSQGQDRLIADSQLRDIIRDRRLWYRGEADLEEHLQNANAAIDPQESKIRIVKRVENLKIDLAVSLSMASHNLLYLNL
jgi:phage terminase large subunit-like protein